MADIELVIKIPKEIKGIIDRNGTNEHVTETLWQAVKNGVPFEDIKVEIQNTIIEQAYEKGQTDAFEKIKAEITEYRNNINAGSDEFHIGRLLGCDEIVEIIDKHISELKGEQE